MKKLQKRNLGVFGIFTCILAMLFTVNVHAASDSCTGGTLDGNEASLTHAGTTKYCSLKNALESVQDGDTIKVEKTVTITNSNGNVDGKGSLASREANITFTIDLNGKTISSSEADHAVLFIVGKSTITIIDSVGNGSIEHTSGSGAALKVQQGTVTLKSGTLKSTADKAVEVSHTSNQGGKFILDGGNIEGESGIFVAGTNFEVEVKSGKITTDSFAISGNGSQTHESKITVSGGEITSKNNAAIYQPQSGSLTITNGTITGKIGIVARQGNVKIEGGTIVGNGDKDEQITTGDATNESGKINLQNGAAVVVDNTATGYGNSIVVDIEGGDFSATADKTVVSTGNTDDYDISGGSYDKPFNANFVKTGSTELSIETSGDKTWYVGNDAAKAIEENKTNANAIIEVEQGDIVIQGAVTGVTVKNKGNGNVTVNNDKVENGTDVIAKARYKIQIGEKTYEVTDGTKFSDFFTDNEDAFNAYLDFIESKLEEAGVMNEEDYENKVSDIYVFNLLTNKRLENNDLVISENYNLDVVVVLKEPAETEPPVQTGDNIMVYSVMGLLSLSALVIGSKKVLKRN